MNDSEDREGVINPVNLPRELRDALGRTTVMAQDLGHTLSRDWIYFPEDDLTMLFGAASPPCFSNTCEACYKRLYVQELPETMEGDLYAFRGHLLTYACNPDRLDGKLDAYIKRDDV